MNEIIFNVLWTACGLAMLIYYAKRKHTLASAFFGMSSGGASLLLLHYFGGYIGYAPPVNLFNTSVSLILGIPGTALIMALNLVK